MTGTVVGVGVESSVALVNAMATPPTATSATTAASPKTNCGNRCQARGSSASGVAGNVLRHRT